MDNNVISIKNISKIYKLYNRPFDRIKDVFFSKTKNYKEFYALKNVSMEVRSGETLAIIGKNGSGKSTLLKIISGVLTETSGEKEINGSISALLELGTGFNPEFTGRENIYLNGTMRGFTRSEMDKKINDILDFADIGGFIEQPVKTYSSGMFARLAFAVMISFKPEILIVDEALSVGDIFFQQKCNRYMKEEMGDVTKILVTHDLGSVANMADRVIVILNGEKVFEGDPLKGIEYYTKSLHTEIFRKDNYDVDEKVAVLEKDAFINKDWKEIEYDSLGGAHDVILKAYKFRVDGEEYKGYISEGCSLEVDLLIESEKNSSEIIVGYLVNDKYGKAIFGENTHSSKLIVSPVKAKKKYIIKLEIIWPEVQENDYFVTLGIGEGFHEMNHVIQCWAHNIIQVKNITFKSVHAIFNNSIKSVKLLES